jgi:hypothetical protein
MMPAVRMMIPIAILATVVCSKLQAADHAAVREAWTQRLNDQTGVVYRATVTPKALGEAGTKKPADEIGVAALMRCDERKFRFDVKPAADRFASLHLLDKDGFHTSGQQLPSQWKTTTERSLADKSDWLPLYPFLLAHGVVPLPPLDAPQLPVKKRDTPAPPATIGGQRVTFEFRTKEPLAVQVTHEAHGLVERYEVTRSDRKLLEVRNKYVQDGKAFRLKEYTVLRFDAQGKLAGHLEGRVTECRLNADIPLVAFTPPRAPDKLRTDLLKALEKTAVVKENPSLADLAKSVQDTLGDGIQVRIDDDAFQKGPPQAAVNVNRLKIKPGEATLSELLLRDLRGSRVDFYLDAQGIVLIPRNEAWNYAGFTEYAAKNYGKTADEMRNLIFSAGTPDDWSDLGGQATIIAGKDGQTLMVLHTQSDHLRFEEQLRKEGD